jgi:hypothetical protein
MEIRAQYKDRQGNSPFLGIAASNDGYQMLEAMYHALGHPALAAVYTGPVIPIMRDRQTISDYHHSMIDYLFQCVIVGRIWHDRAFVSLYVANLNMMHSS